MDVHRYRFRSVWTVDASATRLFTALEDVETYPRWWPEVRRARRVDEDTVHFTVRSVLPYDLELVAHRIRRGSDEVVLEARLSGDLEGRSRWTLEAVDGGGARATFEEDVVVQKPLMRRLAWLARPAFRGNHALMMRRGNRGLRRHLDQAQPRR